MGCTKVRSIQLLPSSFPVKNSFTRNHSTWILDVIYSSLQEELVSISLTWWIFWSCGFAIGVAVWMPVNGWLLLDWKQWQRAVDSGLLSTNLVACVTASELQHPAMSIFRTIAISSIRNHFIGASLWIILQVLFGLLLANEGVIQYQNNIIVDVRGKVTNTELYNYHALSGKVLLGK